MSNNRFQKELNKDIVDCEKYLSRVLKRKIDKQQNSSGQKSTQNVSQDRAIKPFLTGPPSRPHSSSARLKVCVNTAPVLRKRSTEKVLHKECNRSNIPPFQETMKHKSKDKHHKRSLSTGSNVTRSDDSKGNKRSDSLKQKNLVDPLASCKLTNKIFHRKSNKSPDSKRLPWSEVLKENKYPQSQVKNQATVQNTKTKVISKEPVLNSVSRTRCLAGTIDQKYSDNSKLNCGPYNGISPRSEESSDINSSIESVELVNKSVQCRIPSSSVKGESLMTISSMKIPEARPMTMIGSNPGATSVDTFSMFNPVRTLNFLVRELPGFIGKSPEDCNLQRIIVDMEKTLQRIPPELQGCDMGLDAAYYSHSAPPRPAVPLGAETVSRTLATVPTLALRIDSSDSTMITREEADSARLFQKQLEKSCMKLEAMCQEMEANNVELRRQRDRLEEELKKKKQEMENWVNKERDYLQTISTLRTNLESSGHTMAELTNLTSQLRDENKSLLALRDNEFKLNQELQQAKQANNQLEKDLRIIQLEKEKLLVINQGKDNELERFKKEVTDIKSLIMEQLNSLRTQLKEKELETFTPSLSNNTTDVDSVPSEVLQFPPSSRRPVCSSPNSSRTSSPTISASWEMISTIPPVQLDRSVGPEVIVLSPIKDMSSFKSLEPDSMVDMDETLGNQHTVVPVQSKQAQELKDELKNLFEEMRKQTKFSSTNISVPSPPHHFSMVEPEGPSQWTESGVTSLLNSSSSTLYASEEESTKIEKLVL